MPAVLGGGFSLSCQTTGSPPPTPNPAPCPSASHATGLDFESAARLNSLIAAPTATQSGPVTLAGYWSLDDVDLLARAGYGVILPPIGDQGRQGSCVAWGVGYAT